MWPLHTPYADQGYLAGLAGPSAVATDWDVDGISVIKARKFHAFMSDPQRAQPLMVEELDLDSTDEP
jgi:hypothetical protein